MKLFGRSNNQIGIYDNVLSEDQCKILINQFEKAEKRQGFVITSVNNNVHNSINYEVKKSLELKNSYFRDGTVISNIISTSLLPCVKDYKKEYDALNYIDSWRMDDEYNFQKYDGEDDGYKEWHCDGGSLTTCHRVLVWIFYLNDAKSGTDYMYYPDEMDGASYMFRGRGVVWLHKTTCEGIVKLYKVLLHEILHCCYHFDRYWEDDDAPEKYDICVKSEANIIGFAEYFFGKAMEKIIRRVKKRGK